MNFRNFSIETCVHGGWGETIGTTRNWSVRKLDPVLSCEQNKAIWLANLLMNY